MDIQKLMNYWLEGAELDWRACQHLFENKDYPQCLFWGHLVIEKLIKAITVNQTQEPAPYSHDLVFLATKAQIPLTQEQRDHLNEITTFNQFGRYDSEIVSFIQKCTPEYAERYFSIIQSLKIWLKEFIRSKN